MFTEWSKVNSACSIYRVTLHLPSHQWSPSSELHQVISMDQAFTSTECMTMPYNVVDAEYQKVTESVQWTWVIYYWADFVMCCSLVFWPTLQFCKLERYIYEMHCKISMWFFGILKYFEKCMWRIINNSLRNVARSIQEQKSHIYHITWSLHNGTYEKSVLSRSTTSS